MDSLSDLFEKLRISLSDEISNNDGQHPPDVDLLRAIVDTLKENQESIPPAEVQKILPLLKSHLEGSDTNLTAALLEFTAELCKSEDARHACVDAGLIPSLLNCIEVQHPVIVLQTFRVIGNITCDNNKAREEILEAGGVERILKTLKELQNFRSTDAKTDNYETRHHITACGAVLNLSFDNETLQRELIQNGAIPLLLGYIEHNVEESNLALMATNAISCLLDIDEGIQNFLQSRGCEIFVKALKVSSGELSISLTECLRALSEEAPNNITTVLKVQDSSASELKDTKVHLSSTFQAKALFVKRLVGDKWDYNLLAITNGLCGANVAKLLLLLADKNLTPQQLLSIAAVIAGPNGVKQALVSENCVDILQEIISTNKSCTDEDILEKLKISVDLIILLLGDDSCLGTLFAKENNVFIDKILLWTQSNEPYVRNSCPVAIGNIARTEENCIRLVKMEIHYKLIGLLQNDTLNAETDQIQLQISVLSALKNLAIPASNKHVLINAGALDCATNFLHSPDTPSPLSFRAIAVIRLLVQGQEAAVDKVCSQEEGIIKLVSLAQDSGIEGLKSEASRLLATLLKNARKSESILAVVKKNGLIPVVKMITSTHTVMQNEALVGITLAVNVISNELSHKIDESNLLVTINNVLNTQQTNHQTQYNSIAVVEALFIKGFVEKCKLEDCGILQNLENLTNHSHEAIKQRAITVVNKIKNPSL